MDIREQFKNIEFLKKVFEFSLDSLLLTILRVVEGVFKRISVIAIAVQMQHHISQISQ